MSKTAKKAPAKKFDLMKYLPAIILLAGLVIMTICFINVNSQLAAANAKIAEMSESQPVVTVEPEPVDTANDEAARLQAELETTAAELAEAIAAREVADAEVARLEDDLTAAIAIIAEQQVKLETATTALEEAMDTLNLIFGEPAAEAETVEAEEPAAEAETVEAEELAAEAEAEESAEAPAEETETEAAAEPAEETETVAEEPAE